MTIRYLNKFIERKNVTKNEIKREITALMIGASTSAGLLAAEHYGLRRSFLSRPIAYVAGTMGLNAGYGLYLAVSKKKLTELLPILAVQAVGGATVNLAYMLDKDQRQGQLQEALDEAARLKTQLDEALAIEGLISPDHLLDQSALIDTAYEDLSKVITTLQKWKYQHAAMQRGLEANKRRRQAAKQQAKQEPVYETGSSH